MVIYLVGCIIALGFYIGIYWADGELERKIRKSISGEPLGVMLAFTLIVTMGSWVSIVSMIANKAYHADTKNWNT